MKPTKTKAETRKEIGLQVKEFLARGGKVNGIAPGISGRDINSALPVVFEPQKITRTPVLDEIKALELRKNPVRIKSSSKKEKKPHRALIRDDFNEPLRWVWTDDD